MCNSNLCCVISPERRRLRSRVFLSFFLFLVLVFFFFLKRRVSYIIFDLYIVLIFLAFTFCLPSSLFCVQSVVKSPIIYGPYFLFKNERAYVCECDSVFSESKYIHIYTCILQYCVLAFRLVLLSTFRDFYTCWCILYNYRENVAKLLARCLFCVLVFFSSFELFHDALLHFAFPTFPLCLSFPS